jgi:hypothetical protein
MVTESGSEVKTYLPNNVVCLSICVSMCSHCRRHHRCDITAQLIAHRDVFQHNTLEIESHDDRTVIVDIETTFKPFPLVSLATGEYLMKQDENTGSLYFLREGSVRVTRDGYEVAVVSDKGAVFGELSVLLDIAHSASVQCLADSEFYHIEHPLQYLEKHPTVMLHIAHEHG